MEGFKLGWLTLLPSCASHHTREVQTDEAGNVPAVKSTAVTFSFPVQGDQHRLSGVSDCSEVGINSPLCLLLISTFQLHASHLSPGIPL